jgi:excisionase family DNA binding protein
MFVSRMIHSNTKKPEQPRCGDRGMAKLDEFLSIARLATETNMSEPFWRKAILQKRISYIKIGRAVRVRRSALERYLADREVST